MGTRIGCLLAALAIAGCAVEVATPSSTTPASTITTPVAVTTTATSITSPPSWTRPEICSGCPIETVADIPLGEDGVTYLHVGVEETEPVGPGAVDATDDGVFAVIDTGGLGLVTVASGQPSRASLDWPGIKSLIDVAAVDHGFRILDLDELSLQPRVVEVTADGEVSRSVDLPPGLWLEDGLSGIATGPGGELWVELEGGARVAVFDQTTGEYEEHSGYPYPDGLYGQAVEEPFPESIRFVAGDAEVTVETDPGSSVGARLLALNPDRSFVVEKTEVSQDAGGVLLAETSALWFDAGGSLLGEALLPLEDQFTYVASPVVIGPDGLVYYLLTRPDDVAILGIPWNEPAD